MAKKAMTKDELLAVIVANRADALGAENGDLNAERADALDRYFGRPYGNEMEGRSQVVSKDLSDTVDWIMPSLLRVFTSSDKYVQFDPVGPEDEAQAQQETDYVNHVVMKKNPGWLNFHDWFKDALLSKNGYIKHWWNDEQEVSHETYEGLSQDDLVKLITDLEMSGDGIEVVGQNVEEYPDGPQYEIKIRRTKKKGSVRIDVVPPEELRVSRRTRGPVRHAPFVEHMTRKTRSELIEMGMNRGFVNDLPAYDEEEKDAERLARDPVTDHALNELTSADHSMDEVWYREAYLRVDYDGDGIAELRKVVTVGNQIPDGEEWNEEIDAIPFSDITPNRMPHRHIGQSLNDELSDLAEIKTTLLRQMMDNVYGSVNTEFMVNKNVNLSDFLTSRPMGVKRVNTDGPVSDHAVPLVKPSIVDKVIPVLDYLDSVKEVRTGVGRNNMGLDANTLKDATMGAYTQALSQANQKVEMIARLFAETGVKDMALAVHALLRKYQDKAEVVKLRNQWVSVNPLEWRERTDLTVSVGLGTGTKDEIKANLQLMLQLQQQAAQAGIVTPRNVYNLAEKFSDALGFKEQGQFFSDPQSPEVQQMQQGQQQGPDPLVQAEQIKQQAQSQIHQMREEMKAQKDSAEMMFEKYKFDHQHALDIAVAEINAAIKGLRVDLGQPGLGAETVQQAGDTAEAM